MTSPNPTTPVAEVAVLRRIALQLETLDEHARSRAVEWMYDRYSLGLTARTRDTQGRPDDA